MAREITIRIGATSKVEPTLKKIRKAFEEMGADVEETLEDVNEKAEEAAGETSGAFAGVATAVSAALGPIVSIASTVLGTVGKLFGGIGSIIGGAFKAVGSIVSSILNGIVSVAQSVVSGIISAFAALPDALGLVFNKVTALATVAFGFVISKFANLAAESESLNNALDNLAATAGTTGKEIQEAIERGSLGAIGGLDALRLANTALLLNVAKTPPEFQKLAEAALVLGRSMGLELNTAFSSLVIGIGRQSRLRLDDLGIITQLTKAVKKYAEKNVSIELSKREKILALLGAAQKKMREDTQLATFATEAQAIAHREQQKTLLDVAKASGNFSRILDQTTRAEALATAQTAKLDKAIAGLSEEERKIAFLEATMEGAALQIKNAGGVTDDLTTKFGRMKLEVSKVFVAIAETLGPAMAQLAQAITPVVKQFRQMVESSKELVQGRLQAWTQKVIDFFADLTERTKNLWVNTEELRESIGVKLRGAFDLMKTGADKALKGVFFAFEFIRIEFDLFKTALQGFFAGDDFVTSGSGIFAIFELLRAQIAIVANEAEIILRERFGGAFTFISRSVAALNAVFVGLVRTLGKVLGAFTDIAGAIVDFLPDSNVPGIQDLQDYAKAVVEANKRVAGSLKEFSTGADVSTLGGTFGQDTTNQQRIFQLQQQRGGLDQRRSDAAGNVGSLGRDTARKAAQTQEATTQMVAARWAEFIKLTEDQSQTNEEQAGVMLEGVKALDAGAEKTVEVLEVVAEEVAEILTKEQQREERLQALLEAGAAAGNTIHPRKGTPWTGRN